MIGLVLAVSVLAAPPGAGPRPIAADHHVHILGPGLLRDWKSLGVPFSRPDAAYLSPAAVLDGGDAVGQVLLVPMAHFYGNAELREGLRLSVADEHARVRAENDHVAAEAARWPDRAVAFCGVDWRRPYAWDELRRCREKLNSPGIKLHLASAGTDLRDAAQRGELGRIAGWAQQHGLAVLLHFDPQARGLEVADVDRALAEVLGPHPDLEVTVAHLGGSGGYGSWTRAVLRAFTRWLERERGAGRERAGVRFDVSASLLEKESEGVPATTADEARALGDDLRRLGLDRVLFGSDYPVFAPRRLAELFAERTGLTPAEVARVLSNRAPVLARAVAPVQASPSAAPASTHDGARALRPDLVRMFPWLPRSRESGRGGSPHPPTCSRIPTIKVRGSPGRAPAGCRATTCLRSVMFWTLK